MYQKSKQAAWHSNLFKRLKHDDDVLYYAACLDPQLNLFDYEDPAGIRRYLETTFPDMHFLGAGAYAIVMGFKSNPDTVMRLSVSSEDGWWRFARWIKVWLGEHPHVPVIHSMFSKGDLRVAFMDKLYPIAPDVFDAALASQWMLELRRAAEADGLIFNDLHQSNMMVDINNVPIVTDPVS